MGLLLFHVIVELNSTYVQHKYFDNIGYIKDNNTENHPREKDK